MKKSWINPISSKQRIRNQEWKEICLEKRQLQIEQRGYVYCVLCGLPERSHEMYQVWGHHILPRGKGGKDTAENCELDHWICHSEKYHSLRS